MTHATVTCTEVSTLNSHAAQHTYRASQTHLGEEHELLERRQGAEVDRGQSAHCHGSDATEQTVDVRNMILSIGGVEDSGEDQRGECTVGQPSSVDEGVDTEEAQEKKILRNPTHTIVGKCDTRSTPPRRLAVVKSGLAPRNPRNSWRIAEFPHTQEP